MLYITFDMTMRTIEKIYMTLPQERFIRFKRTFLNSEGEGRRFRTHRGGPQVFHLGPERVRTGRSHLTAGHGRLVCQPWFTCDKAAEQRREAMTFAGLLV
jgi:acyl dehydratase